MSQFCARSPQSSRASFRPRKQSTLPSWPILQPLPIIPIFFPSISPPPAIGGARDLLDSCFHQKSTAVYRHRQSRVFPNPTTIPSLSTMSELERTKSTSEVSMKDVDDEVDEYDEVNQPGRDKMTRLTTRLSRHRRKNQKPNTLKMRWKLTRMTNLMKRSVRTPHTATRPETNKLVQDDNLTRELLAEPVSGNPRSNSAKPESNHC